MSGFLNSLNYGGQYGYAPQAMPALASPTISTAGLDLAGSVAPRATVSPVSGAVISPGTQLAQGWQSGTGVPRLDGWQRFGYAMQGLGALGSIWGAIQQNKIANRQLNLAEQNYNTNMNNTIKNYNTNLEDRIRARYTYEGRSQSDMDDYVDRNRLTRS